MVARSTRTRASRALPSAAARAELGAIVREFETSGEPAGALAERAIEVGRYNRGSAWIVPAVDAEASIEREAELNRRIAELEDEVENLAMVAFLIERKRLLAAPTFDVEDAVTQLGFGELLEIAE